MDINSKILANSKITQNLKKFRLLKNISKIILIISIVAIMIFIQNKKEGIIISLFLVVILLCIKNWINDFKDMCVFIEINDISNNCEDIVAIFEKTNEHSDESNFLGKKHQGILNNLYKVEKYIYSSILKGKQNEGLSNELVVEVSKSLKNPVDNIVEGISNFEVNEDIIVNLNIINHLEDQSNLLKHSIDELFELAKVMTGSIELDIQKIDVKSLLKQSLIEYDDKLEEKKLKLKTSIEDSKSYIRADGQQLWRVFEILLDNIVEYSKENSRVYIKLNKEEENISISLINISKEELNIDTNTFLKLIREDSEVNKMGLAIAYNLISVQNGDLEITIDGDMFKVEIKFKDMDSIKA